MDKILEILKDINSTIDYEKETRLIDDKVLDSFSIIALIGKLSDTFDVEIGPKWLKPVNFNSVEAIWQMIQQLLDEE